MPLDGLPELDPNLPFQEYTLAVRRRKGFRRKAISDKKAKHIVKLNQSAAAIATRFKPGQFVGDKSPRWRGGPLAKYGLKPDAYDKMFTAQSGVCAICGKSPKKIRLSIDHNHKTGAVRGLLCFRCNYGIGWFQDDPIRLETLYKYLKNEKDYRAT